LCVLINKNILRRCIGHPQLAFSFQIFQHDNPACHLTGFNIFKRAKTEMVLLNWAKYFRCQERNSHLFECVNIY